MMKYLSILLAAFMPCMARAFVSNIYDTNNTAAVDAHVLAIAPGGTATVATNDARIISLTNAGNVFHGTFTGSGSGLTAISSNSIVSVNGSQVKGNVASAASLDAGATINANQISTSGGTVGQILLNTAAGTVWTNDQSIVQAGSYEFVTSITNPITGQITYTVSGVNTNQFLGAGPGGYRDASSVTNLNPMGISTNTIIFRNTNGVSGYLIQVTSVGGTNLFFPLVFTNGL